MRLWHIDLIPYLPKQQLLGQWRELNSIYKLQNRHVLINFVYDHSKDELYNYSKLVIKAMDRKGYKYDTTNMMNYFGTHEYKELYWYDIYEDKMNGRYLRQCLYNLQEKHDCGGIPDDEWKVITRHFNID